MSLIIARAENMDSPAAIFTYNNRTYQCTLDKVDMYSIYYKVPIGVDLQNELMLSYISASGIKISSQHHRIFYYWRAQ